LLRRFPCTSQRAHQWQSAGVIHGSSPWNLKRRFYDRDMDQYARATGKRPEQYEPEHPKTTMFNKGTYRIMYEIADVASSWIVHHVHESLRKRMKREGLL